MKQECAVCGFVAETFTELPDPWQHYLATERGIGLERGNPRLPLCLGCLKEKERYLDPKQPKGGREVDQGVREFLDSVDGVHVNEKSD